mmetsp:Transcript_136423/g.236662  ORF Transcript_136423/g.236662 Transcript_136423/m.236662 type:complete len:232 (+) Transcript_136423:2628-3323(+)
MWGPHDFGTKGFVLTVAGVVWQCIGHHLEFRLKGALNRLEANDVSSTHLDTPIRQILVEQISIPCLGRGLDRQPTEGLVIQPFDCSSSIPGGEELADCGLSQGSELLILEGCLEVAAAAHLVQHQGAAPELAKCQDKLLYSSSGPAGSIWGRHNSRLRVIDRLPSPNLGRLKLLAVCSDLGALLLREGCVEFHLGKQCTGGGRLMVCSSIWHPVQALNPGLNDGAQMLHED